MLATSYGGYICILSFSAEEGHKDWHLSSCDARGSDGVEPFVSHCGDSSQPQPPSYLLDSLKHVDILHIVCTKSLFISVLSSQNLLLLHLCLQPDESSETVLTETLHSCVQVYRIKPLFCDIWAHSHTNLLTGFDFYSVQCAKINMYIILLRPVIHHVCQEVSGITVSWWCRVCHINLHSTWRQRAVSLTK